VLGGKLITSSDEGAVKHTAREEGIMGHAAAMADWWALSRYLPPPPPSPHVWRALTITSGYEN